MTGLSGRRLAWHSLLNLAGQGFPVLAAVVAVPPLVARLGTERFGILTLVWTIVGYFGLFDFGLGRALTQLIADRRHRTTDAELAALTWKALVVMAMIGLLGCIIAEAIAAWLSRILNITPGLVAETITAFRVTVLIIPVTVVTTGLRGVLEAYQRFELVNVARGPLGALTYLAPLAVVAFSRSLVPVVAALALVRILGLAVHARLAVHVMPLLRSGGDRAARLPRELLHTGGWMTVSNVATPVLVNADRFFIGAIMSAAALAYYTAPFEMVTKLTIVAASVAASLFPAFASSVEPGERSMLYARGLAMTCVVLFPPLIALLLFAPEILRVWLGADFADRSTAVLRMLALGVYVNCLAQISFSLIQAAGKSAVAAVINIVEIPLYLVGAWLLIHSRGLHGAALAWTLRVAVDAAAMFFVASRLAPAQTNRRASALIGLSCTWIIVAVVIGDARAWERAVVFVASTMTVLVFAWFRVTPIAERERLLRFVRAG